MKKGLGLFFLYVLLLIMSNLLEEGVVLGQTTKGMKKWVTEQASFVLYVPEGWNASEGVSGAFRTLFVTDPSGLYIVGMFYGVSPVGNDVLGLASLFASNIRNHYPDLTLPTVMVSQDRTKVVMDGLYTDTQKRRKEFRCWVSLADGGFLYSSIEAPEGKLSASKELMLTILSNVRIMKGAFGGTTAPPVQMVEVRLHDGSASFRMPQNWTYQSLGAGLFVAKDPAGLYSFMVAAAEAITPQLRVNAPGLIVSPYLPPHQALQFFAYKQGLLTDMRFLHVIPRQDLNALIAQVYTIGPATAEEFIYTFRSREGRPSKGYTFGISFGSRLNTNWKLWHMTVAGPLDQFEAFVPHFTTMFESYRINDRFVQEYVARGMQRLREMQRQTSQMVSRNAQEIRQMMQAAYDERQRSMDYIDYQRSNYIRGNSDWISQMEGGTIYHSDRWGTQNTATGEYYQGQAYNYFNFTGRNPKYNEQMQEINSRELFERHMKKPN